MAARIRAEGPLPFNQWVEACLYDPQDGFYSSSGSAGRRGDFITSPEVGPLFGAVLANWIDNRWTDLGKPENFVVLEAGAGPGTLARSIFAAKPKSLTNGRYIAIERSEAQRKIHPEEVESVADFPNDAITGVVIANELLDNLPFHLYSADGEKWYETMITGQFEEEKGREVEPPMPLPPQSGSEIPVQIEAHKWVEQAIGIVNEGAILVIDYCSTTPKMATEPREKWLRTYRKHQEGSIVTQHPGTQDITVNVAVDQLPDGFNINSQADFLTSNGIKDLIEEGKEIWKKESATGGLEAIRARSRIVEAEALLDPNGLGSFSTLEWLINQ